MPKSNMTLEDWCIKNGHEDLLTHLKNPKDRF